jgi:hypothetical protein
MVVTGEGKDRNRATTRKLLLMPRQLDISGWNAVPGWQGSAVVRRQAATTDPSMVSEHRHPRGKESARPGPGLTRVERVNPARVRRRCAGMRAGGGRPTVRGAEFRLVGQGAQEANAGSRKAAGNRRPQDRELLPDGRRITGRIPGLVPGPERGC